MEKIWGWVFLCLYFYLCVLFYYIIIIYCCKYESEFGKIENDEYKGNGIDNMKMFILLLFFIYDE